MKTIFLHMEDALMKKEKMKIREVKRSAKAALGNYYGKAVGATFIYMLLSLAVIIIAMIPLFYGIYGIEYLDDTGASSGSALGTADDMGAFVTVLMFGYLPVVAAALLVLVPLQFGYYRFFIHARNGEARLGTLFSFFKKNYWRSIGFSMLCFIKMWLWGLLGEMMILPGTIGITLYYAQPSSGLYDEVLYISIGLLVAGVVGMYVIIFNKAYKYMMGMHVFAENPETGIKYAFDTGSAIAKGNVGKLFLLNLSYILWLFAASFVPILGVVLVEPLVTAGMTEGYSFLRCGEIKPIVQSGAVLPQTVDTAEGSTGLVGSEDKTPTE